MSQQVQRFAACSSASFSGLLATTLARLFAASNNEKGTPGLLAGRFYARMAVLPVGYHEGMDSPPPKIVIELTPDEALVLFEFLRRSDDEGAYRFADQAEQRVVWNLEIAIQPQVPVFAPNYGELLKQARSAIRDKEG